MPLYETIFLVNAKASLPTVAQVLKQKAQCVFSNGGVIRRLENMGIMPFAYPMYRNRQKHFKGRWVVMLYDASSKCQKQVTDMMRTDPEVIRWAVHKQNDVFRDKYDEYFIHHGKYQGEVPAVERDEEKIRDLNEAIDQQRMMRSERADWSETTAPTYVAPMEYGSESEDDDSGAIGEYSTGADGQSYGADGSSDGDEFDLPFGEEGQPPFGVVEPDFDFTSGQFASSTAEQVDDRLSPLEQLFNDIQKSK